MIQHNNNFSSSCFFRLVFFLSRKGRFTLLLFYFFDHTFRFSFQTLNTFSIYKIKTAATSVELPIFLLVLVNSSFFVCLFRSKKKFNVLRTVYFPFESNERMRWVGLVWWCVNLISWKRMYKIKLEINLKQKKLKLAVVYVSNDIKLKKHKITMTVMILLLDLFATFFFFLSCLFFFSLLRWWNHKLNGSTIGF